MQLIIDGEELRALVREVTEELLSELAWPRDRWLLSESEAAQLCGVGRHVLRDLRLAGKIQSQRVGKKAMYTRETLLRGIRAL